MKGGSARHDFLAFLSPSFLAFSPRAPAWDSPQADNRD